MADVFGWVEGHDAPVSGVSVEAWDDDGLWSDVIDRAVTGADGRFTMTPAGGYLATLFADRVVRLSFRVFHGESMLADTRGRVVWTPDQAAAPVRIVVDPRAAPDRHRPAPFVVRGRAFDARRRPLSAGAVRVLRRGLTPAGLHDTAVAEGPVDGAGWFRVEYRAPDHGRWDLVIEARDAGGTVLAKVLRCQVPTSLVTDLVPAAAMSLPAWAGPSRFEWHGNVLRPVLNGRSLADLDDREATYVMCATDLARDELDRLRAVSRLARDTGAAPAVLAALAHGGLPMDLSGMARHRGGAMVAAVERAVVDNAVPASVRDGLDAQLAALRDRIVEHALRPAAAGTRASLGDVLRASPLPERMHGTLLRRYLDRGGSEREFWAGLARDPEFGPDVVRSAQLALQLALFTDGDAALMARLNQRAHRGVQSAVDLAGFDRDRWEELIREAGTVPGDRVAHQVARIMAGVQRVYPGRALHRLLGREPEIDLDLVRALREANLALDPYQSLPPHPSWGRIGGSDQARARAAWDAAAAEARAYPGYDFAAQLASRSPFRNPVRAGAARLLANLGAPDLSTASLRKLVADRGGSAFDGVDAAVRDEALDQLLATQRVFRVAAPHQVEPLLAAGFRSVRSIARTSPDHFVLHLGDQLGGAGGARAVHDAAVVFSAGVAAGYQALLDVHGEALPYMIGGPAGNLVEVGPPAYVGDPVPPEVKDGVANWRALFGPLEMCDCEHCESAYSPAAYLVDLLHFLDRVPLGGGPRPLKVLGQRRPDIVKIKLTCENTNTPMPYVDLVNEALESYLKIRYVDHGDPSNDLAVHDVDGASASELRAVPQNVLDEAYGELGTSVFPTGLPFHRPLTVTRTYLQHLGVSRLQLMEAYRTAAQPDADAVAAESLGLSAEEFAVIIGVYPKDPQEHYGYPAGQAAPGWWSDLSKVETMLTRSGLDLVELADALRTWWVNPDQALTIITPGLGCDISQMTISGLDAGGVDRLHRFVRLWRALNRAQPGQAAPGWSMADLDRALFAIKASTLDAVALRRIDGVRRATSALRRPLVETLSLWADMDVWGEDALYLKLFRNRAVLQLDAGGALELLYQPSAGPDVRNAQKMPYLKTGNKLGDNIPAVLAGVRLTEPELRLVMDREGITADTPLSVAVLSRLFRYAVLARGTKLRIAELLTLLSLTGVNPYQSGDPAGLLEFLVHRRRVADSRMTVAALDYLCRGVAGPVAGVAPTPNERDNALKALRAGLLAVAEDTEVPDEDPEWEALSTRLASWVAPDAVGPLRAILLGDTADFPPNLSSFLDQNLGWLVAPAQALASLVFPPPAAPPQPPPGLTLAQQKQNVGWLFALVRAHRARDVVVNTLASALRIEPPVAVLLLDTLLTGRVVPGEPAMSDYLALMTADPVPGHSTAYELAHKAALVVRGLRLTPAELAHVSANAAWDGFDLDALPPTPVADAVAAVHFVRWTRVADLAGLRDRLPHGERTLVDVFEHDVSGAADAMKDLVEDLAAVTGWPADLLAQLVGPTGLALATDDLRTERRLLDLERCLAVARRLGVDPAVLFGWAGSAPGPETARAVVRAVKARYDEQEWLDVAQTLNDDLRERQRDALVAYLVPRLAGDSLPIKEGVTTEEDLFGFFLIDTQMSACMLTSRIKQAISSVQLFVQRCLLGLEKSVKPEHIDAQQWRWRKSYRVWEANRKIFLYPENWIRPELDRDRSPFFRELETNLLQADPTDEHVESVYLRYLERLDDVARLKVVGFFHHTEAAQGGTDKGIDAVHVVASTIDGEPREYFYRRFLDSREWTPWEAIDLDIPSDHILPVVFNRRLHLFWLELTAQPLETGFTYPEDYSGQPAQYWQARLAHSERRRGRWTARRYLGRPMRLEAGINEGVEKLNKGFVKQGQKPSPPSPLTPVANFTLVADVGPENVILHVYARHSDAGEYTDWFKPRGTFTVSSYRGQTTVTESVDLTFAQVALPSFASLGRMEVTGVAGPLAIAGSTEWDILGQTPGYRMVRQGTAEFAEPPKQLYRFFLSDDKRHYFAFPPPPPNQTGHPTDMVEVIGGYLGAGAGGQGGSGSYLVETGPWLGGPSHDSILPPDDQDDSFLLILVMLMEPLLRFVTTQHPYTGDFIRALNKDGLDGLLSLATQQLTRDGGSSTDFGTTYAPLPIVGAPLPVYRVDFDPAGSYSRYNWELFFHAPMLIADRLAADGRFEEARRWIHYIFDPTTNDADAAPARFWRLLPFRTNTALERAQDLMQLLVYSGSDPAILARRQAVHDQIVEWSTHPFEPHRIARLRLVAYQKYVVMAYLDCLLAHADSLFRRDTIESNNEAAQLYLLALVILGRRASRVPPPGTVKARSYAELVALGPLGDFSNPKVELENVVWPFATGAGADAAAGTILPGDETLYFCTPDNDKLRGYWDQVEDRLFKLRHCLNIEGQLRALPLFEPPIDPAALVRAVAAGLDLGSAAAEVFAPPPRFRFTYLLARALELCGELRSLAGLSLAALEKADAEALSDLRTSHEVTLLKAVRDVREQQLKEAQHTYDALVRTEETTKHRRDFYANFEQRSAQEAAQLERLKAAQDYQQKANLAEIAVAAAAIIPNVTTGESGVSSPVATITFGGSSLASAASSLSRYLTWMGGFESYQANLAGLEAGWARRADDAKLQEDLANRELAQIAKQLDGAHTRITIAETELANHDTQIEQAGEVADLLREKFTNAELYQWMAAQVGAVYHQAYKVAFDLAKRAERAYRFEHGLTTSSIVGYGWEGTRKGLLAAERLILDLKRLEAAWMDAAPPPYEITKHVSLVLHDPAALMALRLTGSCDIELPETLYDADHPGHYQRRLRSLRVTIPCVTGPYTSINCRVTLESSRERISTADPGNYPENPAGADPRFRYDFAGRQSIVTSHGRSDPGRFALGADPSTYLPFEGAGAICRLRLDLPRESNAFDFDTISDVVLTVEYSAREGGDALRGPAHQSLLDLAALPATDGGLVPPLQRLFSARHEFGQEWHSFLRPAPGASQVLTLQLVPEHLPYPLRAKDPADVSVRQVDLYLFPKAGATPVPNGLTITLGLPQPLAVPVNLGPATEPEGPAVGTVNKIDDGTPLGAALQSAPMIGAWTLTVPGAATPILDPAQVEDLLILITYTAT